MQISVKNLPESSQAELEIVASPEEFAPFIERAVRELTKDKPLKGFRPGKAPLNVVTETFGQERVLSEAMDKALPQLFVEAVLAKDVNALGRPAITINELGLDKGLSFTAKVDVLPEVKLGDPKQIKVEKRPVQTTNETVQQELDYVAKSRSTYIDVARPAQAGDTVMIDFKVSMNNQVIEGGESKNHPVTLGEGHFIPGFEEKLEGINAGDVREFELTFPDTYKDDLKGKKANVWAQAHTVHKRVIPEINDEFAKKLGKFESLQHLKDEFKKNIQLEKEQREEERVQEEAADKLAGLSSFGPLPQNLIDREIEHRLGELNSMLTMQNKTLEDYFKQQNKDIQKVREEMLPAAERNIKISLALAQFAKEQKIEVSDEEINTKAEEYLRRYASTRQATNEIDEAELKNNIAANLRNQKALAKLKEFITVTEPKA